jgi:Flp pilus assembly protein TadD
MKYQPGDLGHGLPAAAAAEYTDAYRRGCVLVKRHMNLHDREAAPSPAREAEVREGIRLLQRAVAILPGSWPAWWMIGKGYQALGDHPGAYEAFRRAARLHQGNADLPRELSLECLHLGKFTEAVLAARQAVRVDGSDPGLQANLALALLLAGDVDEALGQAGQAAAGSPGDEINRALRNITQEVKAGRRPRPKTRAELEG